MIELSDSLVIINCFNLLRSFSNCASCSHLFTTRAFLNCPHLLASAVNSSIPFLTMIFRSDIGFVLAVSCKARVRDLGSFAPDRPAQYLAGGPPEVWHVVPPNCAQLKASSATTHTIEPRSKSSQTFSRSTRETCGAIISKKSVVCSMSS